MILKDFRKVMKEKGFIVKSNGDQCNITRAKLWALYTIDTGQRVTPHLSLLEWQTVNIDTTINNFFKQ